MKRQLLLAIGDDAPSWGLRFACRFLQDKSEVGLTLLCVVPKLYGDNGLEGNVALTASSSQKAQTMLEDAKAWAVNHGFPEANVQIKVLSSKGGVVQTIVNEAHKGLYDAVIVGRRYLNWMERKYTSSVSRGILWENIDFPLWVCNAPDLERKNVLLGVDCMDACIRMADHVGFMLSLFPEHDVTLLHFKEPGCEENAALVAARKALEDNGVAASRISSLVTTALDKAESIVRLANEERFAVVAVGMQKGLNQGFTDTLFRQVAARSVSSKLHQNVNGFALWLTR